MSKSVKSMYALVKYADKRYSGKTLVVPVKDIQVKQSDGRRVAFEPAEITDFHKGTPYIYSTTEGSKVAGKKNPYYVYIGRMAYTKEELEGAENKKRIQWPVERGLYDIGDPSSSNEENVVLNASDAASAARVLKKKNEEAKKKHGISELEQAAKDGYFNVEQRMSTDPSRDPLRSKENDPIFSENQSSELEMMLQRIKALETELAKEKREKEHERKERKRYQEERERERRERKKLEELQKKTSQAALDHKEVAAKLDQVLSMEKRLEERLFERLATLHSKCGSDASSRSQYVEEWVNSIPLWS